MQHDSVTRRAFLKDAAAAAAGVAMASAVARAEPEPPILNRNEQMEYRRLGKTGLMVSAICLGGHWKRIASMGGSGYDRLAGNTEEFDKNRAEVISRCIDVGINYVDACSSGEILTYAKALKGRREKMYMGFSWYEREPRFPEYRKAEALVKGFDDGLKEAGLEYVDVWRMSALMTGSEHTDGDVDEMVAAFGKVHEQGKARFMGISSHDREWLGKVIARCPQVSVILTPYTASSKVKPVDSLFDAVKAHDVGVFGIKPFSSGSLFKDGAGAGGSHTDRDDELARLALRYILCNDAVTAPIPGMISLHQVDNAARAVRERRELDVKEAARLDQAAREMMAALPPDYHWLRDHEWV
ncbi:MAG: aldo/keto reductase [Armatimonadetes bacterium]|nr:aldo/keto reductase [Armatimonadota bacterium]